MRTAIRLTPARAGTDRAAGSPPRGGGTDQGRGLAGRDIGEGSPPRGRGRCTDGHRVVPARAHPRAGGDGARRSMRLSGGEAGSPPRGRGRTAVRSWRGQGSPPRGRGRLTAGCALCAPGPTLSRAHPRAGGDGGDGPKQPLVEGLTPARAGTARTAVTACTGSPPRGRGRPGGDPCEPVTRAHPRAGGDGTWLPGPDDRQDGRAHPRAGGDGTGGYFRAASPPRGSPPRGRGRQSSTVPSGSGPGSPPRGRGRRG